MLAREPNYHTMSLDDERRRVRARGDARPPAREYTSRLCGGADAEDGGGGEVAVGGSGGANCDDGVAASSPSGDRAERISLVWSPG